jgi:uncharacterized membrane protein
MAAKRETFIRWLYRELPDLVTQEVISTQSAQRLREHYGEPGARQGTRLIIAAFGVLGAVLVGSGIILLLAHNWESLSRPLRAGLSFAPLAIGQGVAAWVIARRKRSAAWREGSGAFLWLAVGSSIALVAQTYHIYGDLERFLLTWALLGLLIAYFLDAILPALFTLASLAWWQALTVSHGGEGLLFWPLAAALAPHFWNVARRDRYGLRASLSLWAIPICLAVATASGLHRSAPEVLAAASGSFLASLYLAGALWFDEAPTTWQRPLRNLAALGFAGLALLLSYRWSWEELLHGSGEALASESVGSLGVVILWIAAWLALVVTHLRAHRRDVLPIGALPLAIAAGIAVANAGGGATASAVLFNLYVLTVGVITVRSGAARRRLGELNGGMILIGALILSRFFDSDVGFIARGVAFIAVGTAFLAVNVRMLRRSQRSQ